MEFSFDRNRTRGKLKVSQAVFLDASVEKVELPTNSPVPSCPVVRLHPKGEDEPELEESSR